jgi:hypothetical protein
LPRLRVVFDTNVYRHLSKRDFEKMLEREQKHSILGTGNFMVVMELLAHIADPKDKGFQPSLAALRRLNLHTREYDGSHYITRFIGDSEEHAAISLFKRHMPNRSDQAWHYGSLVGLVAEADSPREWAEEQNNLDVIRSHVAHAEKEFAEDYRRRLILPLVPGAESWAAISSNAELRAVVASALEGPDADRLSAKMLVRRTALLLGIPITEKEMTEKVEIALKLFLTAIRFRVHVLRKIVQSGYDLSLPKNANTLWDIEITFSTNPNALVYGQPIWLITDDRAALAAAQSAGATNVVHSSSVYLELLGRLTPAVQQFITECADRTVK